MDKPLHAGDQAPELPRVAHVEATRPFLWLKLGWQDLRACAGPSLAHGLLLAMTGWLILLFFSAQIDLLAAAISGFLLLGPLFGAAFYELSRLRAAGQPATFDASLDGGLKNSRRLAPLGALLALLAVVWVVLSHLLFDRAFGGIAPMVRDNLYRTVLDWNYPGFFVTYMATGAVLALVAFVLSVVSAPMIFDRAADTSTAILTSVKAVGANPAAMAVWAILIAMLTALGFATYLLGLVIVLPLLGHATWHCYRDLVK
jgi:uncharacterized membrane protein